MNVAVNLLSPNPGLAIWMTITFLLLLFILRRFAWGTITLALREREMRIDESIRRADRALEEAKQIQADNLKARREADQQAQTIVREAREASDRIRAEEVEKTREAVLQIQESARAEIEREKQGALNELRAEVADLAIKAAGKILDENLDNDRQRRLVDSFIRDLGKN
jgi:F-type H+-transporting ATPase subunit b